MGVRRRHNPPHFPVCPQAGCLFAQVIHSLVHRMASQQDSCRLAHRRHVPADSLALPDLRCWCGPPSRSRSPRAAIGPPGGAKVHLHLPGVSAEEIAAILNRRDNPPSTGQAASASR
jgi:hypothetical protein